MPAFARPGGLSVADGARRQLCRLRRLRDARIRQPCHVPTGLPGRRRVRYHPSQSVASAARVASPEDTQMSKATDLRQLLAHDDLIIAPGAYDGLTARLVELAGFPVVYATGAGISNSQLAFADVGLATMTEVLDQVRKMTGAIGIPLIADIDTGYGNAVNLYRTIQEFIRAGRRRRAIGGSGDSEEVRPLRRKTTDSRRRGGDENPGGGRGARGSRSGPDCPHRCDLGRRSAGSIAAGARLS